MKALEPRPCRPAGVQPTRMTRDTPAEAETSLALSPRMTAQRRAIAAAFGTAAGPQRAVVQAKILVKGGPTYAAMKDLPPAVQAAEALRPAVESADSYLAKTEADVISRGQGRAAALLTPHRHLIGERHDASRFEDALKAWGWGADKMVEEFHESTDVVDQITQENRNLRRSGFFTNPLYMAKPLENLHAKVLQTLSTLRFVLGELQGHCGQMGRTASSIDQKLNVDANKDTFKQGAAMMDNERDLARSQWNGGIAPHLPSYKDTCTNRLKTARGQGSGGQQLLHDLATAMDGKWDRMAKNIDILATKPYGLTDSWAETAAALGKHELNIDDFIKNGIDVWAASLVALTKADATLASGDARHDNTVDTGWADAKAAHSSAGALHAIGPMREIFMAHHINTKLLKPGLVQIGADHVTNLNGQITDGKYHKSYDDFDADTRK